MHVGLVISNKEYQFTGNFGWYTGEYFTLLGLKILEIVDDPGVSTILEIRIAKFLVTLYLERKA